MEVRQAELIKSTNNGNNGSTSGVSYVNTFNTNKTRFEIPYNRIPDFISGYCALIKEDEDNETENIDGNYGLGINEIISENTIPLIITMNLKFTLGQEARDEPNLFNESFLIYVTQCIQSVQSELLTITANLSEHICIVLESKIWHVNDVTNISVRFHFPYCVFDKGYYSKIFIPALVKNLRRAKVIEHLEEQPIGDWDTIIQNLSDTLPLYGSKGINNEPPLRLTHIYHVIEDIENTNEFSLKDVFQPMSHGWIHNHRISNDFLAKQVDCEYWLPLFLSIWFWPGITHPKEYDNTDTPSQNKVDYDHIILDKDPKNMLNFLLPLLSVDRITVEPYWLDVGRAIYTIYNGSEEGLRKWIQHSSRVNSEERNEYACMQKWTDLRENFITIKTIGFYARVDSVNEYKEWHDAWARSALSEATTKVHGDVAEAIYRVFWLDYICVQNNKSGWYKFIDSRLRPLDDAIDLRRDISDKLIPMYKNIRAVYANKSKDLNLTEDVKKRYEIQIDVITNLIKALGNQSFKNNVIKFAQEKFFDDNFIRAKNHDHGKMAWLNCVTEVCNGVAYIRPGKPEDYITKTTFIPQRHDLSWEHPLVIALMKYLGQVFVDKELLHFVCKIFASFLYGKNAEKIFQVWTGDRDNSKSMLVKLIHLVLGMYSIDVPEEVFICKAISKSGPSPELAQFEGAHTGFISETDAEVPFKMGAVKKWTGGDRFFARMCGQDGGSIAALLKMILMCNRPPRINDADPAVLIRWLIVPFLSKWSMDAPQSEEEQYAKRIFPMDPFFERKLPDLALALAWVMVQYYPIYAKEGLKQPKIVTEYTDKYWQENDPCRAFIQENIEYALTADGQPDRTVSLTATEMYPVYKLWYRDNYPGMLVPIQSTFKANMMMSHHLGDQHQNRWWGIRLRQFQGPLTQLPQ